MFLSTALSKINCLRQASEFYDLLKRAFRPVIVTGTDQAKGWSLCPVRVGS